MDIIRLKIVLITRGEQGSLKLKRLTNIASAFEAHSLPEIFEYGHDENCPIHQSELGISFIQISTISISNTNTSCQ